MLIEQLKVLFERFLKAIEVVAHVQDVALPPVCTCGAPCTCASLGSTSAEERTEFLHLI